MKAIPERPNDGPAIENLLDICFGSNRLARVSYQFRETIAPLSELGYIVLDSNHLAGTIRFWPIRIDGTQLAILLGPLAVHPNFRLKGAAACLVNTGLSQAKQSGYQIVIAIGDQGYLGRFGFTPAASISAPHSLPIPANKLLILALRNGALNNISGVIRRAN